MQNFKFESEDRIRIINKQGLDCILAFEKEDAPDGIKVVCYCKRDNWNPDLKKGKHTLMERRW